MDYSQFAKALEGAVPDQNAAQWHGLLCGLICAGRPVDSAVWFDCSLAFVGEPGEMSGTTGAVLDSVYKRTRLQLDGAMMEFNLMLPEDTSALELRADALRLWCEGFLYGLSAGGLDRNMRLSADAAGFVQDLAEFCKISLDENESAENDEFYLLELIEYVRAGVLLLYDELSAGNNFNQAVH